MSQKQEIRLIGEMQERQAQQRRLGKIKTKHAICSYQFFELDLLLRRTQCSPVIAFPGHLYSLINHLHWLIQLLPEKAGT